MKNSFQRAILRAHRGWSAPCRPSRFAFKPMDGFLKIDKDGLATLCNGMLQRL